MAYLHAAHNAAGIHPRCHIHRVTPNIILRLLCADDAGNHRSVIQADAQSEPLEALTIDLIQYGHQSDAEFHHNRHVVLLHAAFVLRGGKFLFLFGI